MYTREEAKKQALKALKKAIGKGAEISVDDLDTPPDATMGDLAFPCFTLAKQRKANPAEIATELAAKIGPSDLISGAKAVGPYVNFLFSDEAFVKGVLGEVKKMGGKYGQGTSGKGVKVVTEGGDPNTHKGFHIGHIRDGLYSAAVTRILRANGYDVTFSQYIGDAGSDVAKIVWGLQTFHADEEPAPEDRIAFLTKVYVETNTHVEENPEAAEQIKLTQQAIEKGEDPWHSLYSKTRQWSLDYFKEVFKELNVQSDLWYFESEQIEAGKEMVQKLLTDGVAKKSEGAVVVDLEDEDLGVMLILKSDGTALYATYDLALAYRKDREHGADRYIIFTDVRQSLYFKQLFATLKRAGFKKQMTHLWYEFVTLPDGAMSTRKGNVISYESLRDSMREHLVAETRSRHEDWSDKKVTQTAHALQQAAMAFMMLRQDPESIITFDMKEAMSFEGFTAPYILYTVARIESIKKKAKVKRPKLDPTLLTHEKEQLLVRQLALYPDVVQKVGKSFKVSGLAVYAFELAKLFNEYYHDVHITTDEEKARVQARVALIEAVRQTLENAMDLLGINVLDEM